MIDALIQTWGAMPISFQESSREDLKVFMLETSKKTF